MRQVAVISVWVMQSVSSIRNYKRQRTDVRIYMEGFVWTGKTDELRLR